MSSYKIWKMINEASGTFNLGLSQKNTVGIIGSNLTEAPLDEPLEDEDLEDEDDEDEEFPEEEPIKKFPPEEPDVSSRPGDEDDDIGPEDDLDVPPELLGTDDLSGDVHGDDPSMGDDASLGDDLGVGDDASLGDDPGMGGTSSGLDAIQPLSDDDLAAIDKFGDEEESPVGNMSMSGDLDVPPEITGEPSEDEPLEYNPEDEDGEEGEESEEEEEDETPEEEEDEIAKSMRRFMSKDKKCCTCKKHCSDKCRDECPKCGKKGNSEETEGFETEEQFMNSLVDAMREGHPRKHDDGIHGSIKTEDALYAMSDPNANLNEPQAGDPGFAPQGKIGQIGGGWTKEEMNVIPTLEAYLNEHLGV
jgi:hypothetical protein